jgi:hypothetical protein
VGKIAVYNVSTCASKSKDGRVSGKAHYEEAMVKKGGFTGSSCESSKGAEMAGKRRSSAGLWSLLLIAFVLVAMSACNSGSASKEARGKSAATASGSTDAHIDVMCVGERITNPPEAFHYSYKYEDASGSLDKEADITPQTMEITIQDKSGSHSYHGVRSNEDSWNRAVLDLSGSGMTAMSARLASLNGTSAMINQGADAVNGYDTGKYSIDTTSASSSDKKKFAVLFGQGSFEKGTVWMGPDGCAVKLILDEEFAQMNGSVDKRHYEMARTKK